MTNYQAELIGCAEQYWEQGRSIPVALASQMASTGLDIIKIEAMYSTQSNQGE